MMRIGLLLPALFLSVASAFGADLCYGLGGDSFVGYGLGIYGYTYSAAIEVPEDVAAGMTGSQVAEVSIGFHTGLAKKATIFLTYDLDGEPFYEQPVEGLKEGEYNSYSLSTPYLIEGKRFYIGYTYKTASKTGTPIGFDNSAGRGNTAFCYVKSSPSNGDGEWTAMPELGVLALRATVTGDNLPEIGAVPKGISLPEGVAVNNEFTYTVTLVNLSAETLDKVDVRTVIDDKESVSSDIQLPEPVAPSGEGHVEVAAVCDHESEDLDVTAFITRANGHDNPWSGYSVADKCTCSDFLYPRIVVAEEFTGTGCGYCPKGLYSLEILSEKYPDTFIPIEVQNYRVSEPMYCPSYAEWAAGWVYSAPATIFNRTTAVTPDPATIVDYYKAEAGLVSYYLEAEAAYSDKTYTGIDVKTSATFGEAFSDHNMALSFVILENNVGPYMQTNYYSGSSTLMGGWEDLPEHVSMTYNNVARDIIDWQGRENTLPQNIEKGETAVYETLLPFSPTDKAADINVVVLLIDRSTGRILTACRSSVDAPFDSVEGVIDDNLPTEISVVAGDGKIAVNGVFDCVSVISLDGICVAKIKNNDFVNVPSGVYILQVINGLQVSAAKVIVR